MGCLAHRKLYSRHSLDRSIHAASAGRLLPSQFVGPYAVTLSCSLLSGWVDACCQLLSPLDEALQRYVLTDGKLHANDTPVPVLLPGNGKTKTGRL